MHSNDEQFVDAQATNKYDHAVCSSSIANMNDIACHPILVRYIMNLLWTEAFARIARCAWIGHNNNFDHSANSASWHIK